jgi:sugar phosphate isomerase/epimerase
MARVGLQLYTIREVAEKDILGVIRAVGKIGYDGIEFAGFHGRSGQEIRRALDDAGMDAAGAVFPLSELESRLGGCLEDCLAINGTAILFPWIDVSLRKSADDYRRFADRLNGFGRACRESGLDFLYHIHGYEFETFEGVTGLQLLVSNFNPEWVGLELDTYWVVAGGADPLEVFLRYESDCRYLHFKDTSDRTTVRDVEVGEGVLDFAALIRAAKRVKWHIVEQERFDIPVMESIAISHRNLRRLVAENA